MAYVESDSTYRRCPSAYTVSNASDVVMPLVNGRELSERLAVEWPGLRMLFMSGYTDDDILRRGLLRPGSPFLQKPFMPGDLSRKVREVLDT